MKIWNETHGKPAPRTVLAGILLAGLLVWQGGPPRAQAQETEPEETSAVVTNAVNRVNTNATDGAEAPDETVSMRDVGERVSVGASLAVPENQSAREAVTVFGSSQVAGRVTRELVTVFGNADLSGTAEREMVTVFGSATMNGSVAREMVTVFGDAEVNGPVGRECVTVFGNLKLGPEAKVGRECVVIFGAVERDPGAELAQEPISVLPQLAGARALVTDGLLKGRLVPPASSLAWVLVGLHLILYGLIALLLPRPVKASAETLVERPLAAFGVGLLVLIVLGPLYLILAATGVGVVLIPFLALAEAAFVCLGKTAAMEAIGLQLFRGFGARAAAPRLPGFLAGFGVITLLYMVPVIGLLAWLILKPVALGAATLACFRGVNKPRPTPPPINPVPPQTPPSPGLAAGAHSATNAQGAAAPSPAPVPPPPSGAQAPSALSPQQIAVLPRAGFWIRLMAVGLDFIALCWILMLPYVDSLFLFIWLLYHIGMWAWKGTTIGGIVCNLKVIRLDGREPDLAVSLVRGLAGVFSALPLLLGFFWAGWTRERQSWHDKIAGTVIVRVPSGISLL